MRKYLLLVAGLIASPFIGTKPDTTKNKIDRTVKLVKKATGDKSTIEIKPIDKMLLAPQDVSGGGGDHGRGRGKRKTVV